jgi:ribosomal protein S3
LQLGFHSIKTQTLALKINYGFTTAETYTGTFGVHVWIYQQDSILELLFFSKNNFDKN